MREPVFLNVSGSAEPLPDSGASVSLSGLLGDHLLARAEIALRWDALPVARCEVFSRVAVTAICTVPRADLVALAERAGVTLGEQAPNEASFVAHVRSGQDDDRPGVFARLLTGEGLELAEASVTIEPRAYVTATVRLKFPESPTCWPPALAKSLLRACGIESSVGPNPMATRPGGESPS